MAYATVYSPEHRHLTMAELSDAPVEAVERVLCIAQERHRAINWLVGAAGAYAQVVTAS